MGEAACKLAGEADGYVCRLNSNQPISTPSQHTYPVGWPLVNTLSSGAVLEKANLDGFRCRSVDLVARITAGGLRSEPLDLRLPLLQH